LIWSRALLLAGAALLLTAGDSQAQRGRGRGGFRGGAVRAYRGGAVYRGYRGYYGGYRGYRGYYGYRGYGYRPYWGYRGYWGYGYYPYLSGYTYAPTYVVPSATVVTPYTAGYPVAPAAGNYDYDVPPDNAQAPTNNTASITLHVPADAQVWFNGDRTTSTGPVREFTSPPLTSGKNSSSEARATWRGEDGRPVTQTQKVYVSANSHVDVTFPVPAESSGTGEAGPSR
jgi:uncharacterized protein (TIGR03000 family)